jgi:tellurium resistance protein TerD
MVQDINLVKGQKVSLTKENPSLTTVDAGLCWDETKTRDSHGNEHDCDLDAFALLLVNGKYKECVYFNHLTAHGVTHSGDNLTGRGAAGEKEIINTNFPNVDAEITEIVLCVNIYEAREKEQNFGQVRNAGINLYDATTRNLLCKFDLNEDYSANTGVQIATLYRHEGGWKFNAQGTGFNGTIQDFVKNFS